MNRSRRRIVFSSVAMLLIASAVSPQQTGMVVLSASGVPDVILKVKAFDNDRRFIIRAIGDAVVGQDNSPSAAFSLKIADPTPDLDVKAYGCGEQTARLNQGIGKLHVETSCEIIVKASKTVTVKVVSRSSGGAMPENITLEATSSW
jgi:hypothetical protein